MARPQPFASPASLLLEQHLSPERSGGRVIQCGGRPDDAIELYAWNGAVTAAFWEQPGHVEVLLRDTPGARLGARHARLARPCTWLDDPARELTDQARRDSTTARSRVRVEEPASHGQGVSEPSSTLWPDLASGFPHAPSHVHQRHHHEGGGRDLRPPTGSSTTRRGSTATPG